MHTEHPTGLAVVYGDDDTINNHADIVRDLADTVGLDIQTWHSDPDGTRGASALDGADGLVSALSDCARLNAALFVPYPVDMPGEQTWRLVAHWLNRRGLRLQVGPVAYCWQHPADEFDFAIRRTLDSAHALDAAVVARGVVPAMEVLLNQITGHPARRCTPGTVGVLDTEPTFYALRIRRDRDLAAGRHVPAEPDPAAAWPQRCEQARAFAAWLQRYASQSVVADVLNAGGVKPRRGALWTQPMISRLLRREYTQPTEPDAA